MKKCVSMVSVVAMLVGGAAMAQTIPQARVIGPSGDAVFSLRVADANGVQYDCRPELTRAEDGTSRRTCRLAQNAAAATAVTADPFAGVGSVPVAAIVGGVTAVALLAVAFDSSSGTN